MFERKNGLFTEYDNPEDAPVVIRLFMKLPFVGTQKSAEVLILIIAAVMLAVSIYYIIEANKAPVIKTLPVYSYAI